MRQHDRLVKVTELEEYLSVVFVSSQELMQDLL